MVTPIRTILFFLILHWQHVLFAQSKDKIKELTFFVDPECGLYCEGTGGYSLRYKNNVLIDSVFTPCKINNKPVDYKKYIANLKANRELNEISYIRDTALIKLYDLNGNPISRFYVLKGFFMDTVGTYIQYYPNGKIALQGKFFKYTYVEFEKICKGCDVPRSSRDQTWLVYDQLGNLKRKIKYDKGKVIL